MSSTDKPLVSVVMATYNTEYAMLREAVESLINQTYSNWELILIDDCSDKFNDFSFLDEYQDSRIKLFHNEENLGCTKCFNKGIRLAQGKYIARLDADDIALPKRFEVQVRYMERHPETGVVSGRFNYFGLRQGVMLCVPNNDGFLRTTFLFYNCFAHSTLMFRRDLFDVEELYYDESFRYAQDYDLLVRVIGRGIKIVQLPECLVYIRVHNNQISTENTKTKSQQNEFISAVSCRQLDKYYGMSEEDIVSRDNLVNASLYSTDKINAWTMRILKANKENGCFDQHYLRLVLVGLYARYMRLTGDSSCLWFVIRRMGLELVQTFFIFCYRRSLKYVYSLKYGSTGTKS